MTTKTDQLYAALELSRTQVPYTVNRTEEGFRVELDLFTPAVMQRARRMALTRSFSIDVRLDESKQKAKLTDTIKEIAWGSGRTMGFTLNATMHRGAVTGRTFTFGGSDQDKAHALEMAPFTIKAAKAWVRELLETNGWKVGGLGALFR